MSVGAARSVGAQQPALADVLEAAARYIADYRQALTAVVSDEAYRQEVSRSIRSSFQLVVRDLRSEVAIVEVPRFGLVNFRDVLAVDHEPVQDRAGRLMALFVTGASSDPVAQAERITEESTRHNLNAFGIEIERTINYPAMALRFLQREHQPRSTFTLQRFDRIDGARVAVVEFVERARPGLIATTDDAMASGRFWIDPVEGRVLRTEVGFETTDVGDTARIKARVTVRFAEEPAIGLWMPVRMEERYEVQTNSALIWFTGRADYSNFRKFAVDVSTIIKR